MNKVAGTMTMMLNKKCIVQKCFEIIKEKDRFCVNLTERETLFFEEEVFSSLNLNECKEWIKENVAKSLKEDEKVHYELIEDARFGYVYSRPVDFCLQVLKDKRGIFLVKEHAPQYNYPAKEKQFVNLKDANQFFIERKLILEKKDFEFSKIDHE